MNYILNQLVENGVIAKSEFDDYKYALSVLLLKIMHYFIIFIISVCLGIISETVLFLYCYSAIRTYIGGIHANNPLTCLFISILFIIGLKVIINIHGCRIFILLFAVIISYYFYINCSKSLSNVKFLFHIVFMNSILLALLAFDCYAYTNCILYGFVLNIFLFNMKNIL